MPPAAVEMSSEQTTTVIGGKDNFWIWSEAGGFDLTHPPQPTSPPVYPRLPLVTTRSLVTVDLGKSALVVIDLQNYFLSPAMGRPAGSLGLQLVDKLVVDVLPACRKAGMPVVWLGWGLTDDDVDGMPPNIARAYTLRLDTNFVPGRQAPGGLGAEIGPVQLEDGRTVDGGHVLMRGQWNTAFDRRLVAAARPEDIWVSKNRHSGFWGGTDVEAVLVSHGIRTLFFSGANLDQCVATSAIDAYAHGWDCLLLSDACATTSPDFARQCVEFECAVGWGFVLTCQQLADGIDNIQTAVPAV